MGYDRIGVNVGYDHQYYVFDDTIIDASKIEAEARTHANKGASSRIHYHKLDARCNNRCHNVFPEGRVGAGG